jgi:pyridoxamine--pyruvate transaminase
MAPCVTAVAVPAGLDQAAVCDYVRARYDVMISGSEGAGNLVRIGHMGPTASAFHPVVGWRRSAGPSPISAQEYESGTA